MVIPEGSIVLVLPRRTVYTVAMVWIGVVVLVFQLTQTVQEIEKRYVEYTALFEKLSVEVRDRESIYPQGRGPGRGCSHLGAGCEYRGLPRVRLRI